MDIKQVTPAEAKEALDSDPEAVYLDVRSEAEFAEGHAPGAINVPILFFEPEGRRENPDFLEIVEKVLPKEKEVFCGCKMGGRSQMAATRLLDAGYTRVANINGGFHGRRDPSGQVLAPGWVDLDLPVSTETGDDASYEGQRKKAGLI